MKIPNKIPREAKKVFSGINHDVYQWQQKLFDGSFTTFEMIKRDNAVSVIPIIDNKLVILHEEQPTHPMRISFPGGQMDPGESPLEAAKRELLEETGMTFKTVRLVAVRELGGSRMDWWVFRFVATDIIEQVEPHIEPGERIEVALEDFATVKKLSKNNVYLSQVVMDQANSIDDLLALPEIHS